MTTVRAIERAMKCIVSLRMSDDQPLLTDNGNMIADAHTGPHIKDPAATERMLLGIAGVVQVGLFIDMCDIVVLASSDGVTVHRRN